MFDWVSANTKQRRIPADLNERIVLHSLELDVAFGPNCSHWRHVLILGNSPAESCELASYYVLADRLRLSNAPDRDERALVAHLRTQGRESWPVFQSAEVLHVWLRGCLEAMRHPGAKQYELISIWFFADVWPMTHEYEQDLASHGKATSTVTVPLFFRAEAGGGCGGSDGGRCEPRRSGAGLGRRHGRWRQECGHGYEATPRRCAGSAAPSRPVLFPPSRTASVRTNHMASSARVM